MKILGIAAVLFAISLISFYQALSLIPTDLGFTWMTGGFITFAASALAVVIGFATDALIRAQRMGTMLSTIAGAASADRPRIVPDAPSMEQAFSEPSSGDAAAKSRPSLGTGAMIGAGALAAGAAGMLASKAGAKSDTPRTETSGLDASTPANTPATSRNDENFIFDLPPLPKAPSPINDAILEDFERDLFAEFPALRKDPSIEPLSGDGLALVDPVPPVEPPAQLQTEELPSERSEAPVETFDTDIASETQTEAPQPGLIADADLAALEDAPPALAPIETLDIVGAYDSGGTRFTMYSDGSVTAIGPTMDQRYASLDALRAFLNSGPKG